MSLLAFLIIVMHQLDITYHNTYNCKALKIEDNSIYDDTLPVKNPILEIKGPGLTSYVPFYFPNKKWKSITLNCSSLKLCSKKKSSSTLTILPDGIYDIKYSIDPNLKSMVEFSHMRVCRLMSNYIKLVGLFLSKKSEIDKSDIECLEKAFIKIKDTIDASVYAVEELLDNVLGLELYSEAANKVNEINNGNFKGCCK